jgi:hypothetical protein
MGGSRHETTQLRTLPVRGSWALMGPMPYLFRAMAWPALVFGVVFAVPFFDGEEWPRSHIRLALLCWSVATLSVAYVTASLAKASASGSETRLMQRSSRGATALYWIVSTVVFVGVSLSGLYLTKVMGSFVWSGGALVLLLWTQWVTARVLLARRG